MESSSEEGWRLVQPKCYWNKKYNSTNCLNNTWKDGHISQNNSQNNQRKRLHTILVSWGSWGYTCSCWFSCIWFFGTFQGNIFLVGTVMIGPRKIGTHFKFTFWSRTIEVIKPDGTFPLSKYIYNYFSRTGMKIF